jgi:polysaccharide biosynthesis protein PslH
MKVLFLSRWFPYPPSNGSKLRIYNLLRGLAQHHEVTLLSFADDPNVNPAVPELQSLCREVQVVPWKSFDPLSRRARFGFLHGKPRSVVDTFSPEMARLIQQTLAARAYDLIVSSQLQMAGYAPYFGGLPALFEEVELGLYYEQFMHATSALARLRYGLTWLKHRYYVTGLLRHFHACTVASEQEKKILARVAPSYKAINIIPNCINLADYKVHQPAKPNQLIFTGSFRYSANYDAVTWFLQTVYPRIQAELPDVQLTITGEHDGLPLPPAENIRLTGFVDDVRPLIAQSWISVVPIRNGGGTRLKVLEAMALGTPVVSTTKGAEGLDVQHDVHLLLADGPAAFAEAIIRLLKSPDLRQRLVSNAFEVVRRRYDWSTTMPRFLNLVEQTAQV